MVIHQSIPGVPFPPRADPWNLPFFLMDGKFPGAGALKLSNAQRCGQKERANARLYIMNQMQSVAKRNNSCTLEAPNLAVLKFGFNKITEIYCMITKKFI